MFVSWKRPLDACSFKSLLRDKKLLCCSFLLCRQSCLWFFVTFLRSARADTCFNCILEISRLNCVIFVADEIVAVSVNVFCFLWSRGRDGSIIVDVALAFFGKNASIEPMQHRFVPRALYRTKVAEERDVLCCEGGVQSEGVEESHDYCSVTLLLIIAASWHGAMYEAWVRWSSSSLQYPRVPVRARKLCVRQRQPVGVLCDVFSDQVVFSWYELITHIFLAVCYFTPTFFCQLGMIVRVVLFVPI